MKFSINNRKSWFWHWFVMTSYKRWNKDSVYKLPISVNVKYRYPLHTVIKPCCEYGTVYECELFYRHRAIKHKHCPVYQY